MKHIFIILLNIMITAKALAAAAATAAPTTVDKEPTDYRQHVSQHVQRVAAHNELWFRGLNRFASISKIDSLKEFTEYATNSWDGIKNCAVAWEANTADLKSLKDLINRVLTKIPICESMIHGLSVSSFASTEFVKITLNNFITEKKDLEDILQITLPFTDPAYQKDCEDFRPAFDPTRKKIKELFTFNEAATIVYINDGEGSYVTLPLHRLPTFNRVRMRKERRRDRVKMRKEGARDGDDLVDVDDLAIEFESGLKLIRNGRTEAQLSKEWAKLMAAVGYHAALAAVEAMAKEECSEKSGSKTKEAKAAAEKERSKKSGNKAKGAARAVAKAAPDLGSPPTVLTAASASVGASTAAAGDDERDPLELLLERTEGSLVVVLSEEDMRKKAIAAVGGEAAAGGSGAGAGAAASGGGKLPAYVKERTLALAYGRPITLPRLSSYATYASASSAAGSMDSEDKTMLANLLKVNDGSFGPSQKTNTYKWTNLERLLTHLGFTKTKPYEFTYNGNSIRLHYVHWAKHALDDDLVGILFAKLANIGLTEEMLKRILGIAEES